MIILAFFAIKIARF